MLRTNIKFSVMLIALFIWGNEARSVICAPPAGKPDSAYDYFLAIAESLKYAKQGRELVLAETKKKKKVSDWGVDMLTALKTAQQHYDCGFSYLAPFSDSRNESIAKSATGLRKVLLTFMQESEDSVKDIKAILSGEASKIDEGTLAENRANRLVASKENTELMAMSVVMATYSAVENEKDGKKIKMILNSQQKSAVIERFEKYFGKYSKNENRGIETSASLLIKFLKEF